MTHSTDRRPKTNKTIDVNKYNISNNTKMGQMTITYKQIA